MRLGAMSPGKGSGTYVLLPPLHPHPTYQQAFEEQGQVSRTSDPPGRSTRPPVQHLLDEHVWLGRSPPPAAADPEQTAARGPGPGIPSRLGAQQTGDVLSLCFLSFSRWQLLLPPTENGSISIRVRKKEQVPSTGASHGVTYVQVTCPRPKRRPPALFLQIIASDFLAPLSQERNPVLEGHGCSGPRISSPFHRDSGDRGGQGRTENCPGGGKSRPPLPSQPAAGGTEDPGALWTEAQETLQCSQVCPIAPPLPSPHPTPFHKKPPLSPSSGRRAKFLPPSHLTPQEGGVKTWGEQVSYMTER